MGGRGHRPGCALGTAFGQRFQPPKVHTRQRPSRHNPQSRDSPRMRRPGPPGRRPVVSGKNASHQTCWRAAEARQRQRKPATRSRVAPVAPCSTLRATHAQRAACHIASRNRLERRDGPPRPQKTHPPQLPSIKPPPAAWRCARRSPRRRAGVTRTTSTRTRVPQRLPPRSAGSASSRGSSIRPGATNWLFGTHERMMERTL